MAEVNSFRAKQMETFQSMLKRVQILLKKLKPQQRDYENAKKRILGLSESKINDIVQRHMNNPEKMNGELEPLFKSFLDNTWVFLSRFLDMFPEIEEITRDLDVNEFRDLKKVEGMLNRWFSNIHHSYYTKSIISDLEKEFNRFRRTVQKVVGSAVRNDKALAHGQNPHVGFWTKVKSEFALEGEVNRLAKRTKKDEEKLKLFEDELNRQLSSGTKLNFPYLFAHYLHEEGVVEALLARIEKDVQMLVYDLYKDAKEVLEHAVPILRLTSNYTKLKHEREEIIKLFNSDSFKAYASCTDYVRKSYGNNIAIAREMQHETDIFHRVVSALTATEQSNVYDGQHVDLRSGFRE